MKLKYSKPGFLILVLTFCAFQAIGQVTVSGTVLDADNADPIIGANVIVAETANGTLTDFDGKFTLASETFPVTVNISLLGYTSQIITINDATPVTVKLAAGNGLR